MKCKCGSTITINDKSIANINGNFIVVCSNCNRVYNESDFSEIEIEKSYWKHMPTEAD